MGRVTDSTTGRGIAGVGVVVDLTWLGVTTDEQGNYRIADVPTGSWTLKVTGFGHSKDPAESVLVVANRTTTVNFRLGSEVIYIAAPPYRDERPMLLPDWSNNNTRGWVFRGSPARIGEYGTYMYSNDDRAVSSRSHRVTATVLDFPVPSPGRQGVGMCSPAIADGVAYFGSFDRNYYAVDIRTGKELWRFKVSGGVSDGSPAVDGHLVFLPGPDRFIHAVDRKTGKEVRRFAANDMVSASPAVLDGKIYYGSSDGRLRAADIATGRQVWEFKSDRRPGSVRASRGIVGSSAVCNGVVYFGTQGGYFYAVDLKTGRKKWRFVAEGGIEVTPAVADGSVVFGTTTGRYYALDTASGKRRWEFLPERAGPANSPAISRGMVYFTVRRGSLYALELETGYERWRNVTICPVRSSPAVSLTHGLVYFGCNDSCLHAVGMSGVERWYYRAGSPIYSTPTIVGNVVYFGTMNPGALIGLRAGGN